MRQFVLTPKFNHIDCVSVSWDEALKLDKFALAKTEVSIEFLQTGLFSAGSPAIKNYVYRSDFNTHINPENPVFIIGPFRDGGYWITPSLTLVSSFGDIFDVQ